MTNCFPCVKPLIAPIPDRYGKTPANNTRLMGTLSVILNFFVVVAVLIRGNGVTAIANAVLCVSCKGSKAAV